MFRKLKMIGLATVTTVLTAMVCPFSVAADTTNA